jgi:hypothetical protein
MVATALKNLVTPEARSVADHSNPSSGTPKRMVLGSVQSRSISTLRASAIAAEKYRGQASSAAWFCQNAHRPVGSRCQIDVYAGPIDEAGNRRIANT